QSGIVNHGDTVVITAGVPVGESGTTNLMKVHVIGDILAKAQGIGKTSISGKIAIAKNAQEAIDKADGNTILVTIGSDKDMVPALEKAAGLITEEGGLTCHAAVVGLSLGLPVVVGLENATQLFEEGQQVTLDATTGIIYNGKASIL
ncbi:PEP-utilizing enzyme, partial [Guptibacillus hwajinpoensis]